MNSISAYKVFQTSEIKNGTLIFEKKFGFYRAVEDGFFYLKIPNEISLKHLDAFSRSFYKPEWLPSKNQNGLESLELGKLQGYFLRENDQAEQLFIERNNWNKILPMPVVMESYRLLNIATLVLKSILQRCKIPDYLMDRGTGYALTQQGTHTYTFNHYRLTNASRGLNEHKDSGWLTLLRSFEPGLEVNINDAWYKINPKPGYWIVNFGCAMEIFTRNLKNPVRAVPHRVKSQTNAGRCTYALFLDSAMNGVSSNSLYEYIPKFGLKEVAKVDDFLEKIVKNTYTKNGVGYY